MKETKPENPCIHATKLKNSPGAQLLIDTNRARVSESTDTVCWLLIPTFSDQDTSKKDIGCYGKTNDHCPNKTLFSYELTRSETFKDYKPYDPNKY
jgi:hypothetical protein